MTGKERILATIHGEAADHFAFMPISMSVAADEIGVKYRIYAEDWRTQARGQVAFAEAFGADHVSVISDPCVEATDLGARTLAPEDQPAGFDDAQSLLRDKALFSVLRLPAPGAGRRSSNRLAALTELKRQVGKELLVEGWVEGPCAESADLRGVSRLMMDFYDDPDFARDLVAFVTEMEIAFARAQIAEGADIIGVGDAVSSLIGPGLFEEFALAAHRSYVEAIHEAGALARLHICGNAGSLLKFTKELGYDIIDLDSMVDPEMARQEAGGIQVFSGNLDPVRILRDGDAAVVMESLETCRRSLAPDLGRPGSKPWIVGAGCEIPRNTPRPNILAMRDFARGHKE